MRDLLFSNKSVKQTLVKNTLWLTLGEAISRFSKFFLIMVAARVLEPEGYGQFNYIVSFLAIFFEFSDIGLSDYFIKAYQNSETKEKIGAAFLIFKSLLVSGVGVIALIVAFFTLPHPLFFPFLIIFIMTLIDKAKGSLVLFSVASQEMEKHSAVYMVETVVTTLVGITVLLLKKSLILFCLAYLTGSTCAFFVAIFLSKGKCPKLIWNQSILKPVAVGAVPFIIVSFCNAALISSDTLMIGGLIGMANVGYFSAGQRIFKLITQNLDILLTVSYPVLCNLLAKKETVLPLMRKITSIMILLTLPIACIGVVASDIIIRFLFGPEYLHGISVFYLFMVLAPITGIYEVFLRYYYAANSQKTLITVIVSSTVLNVVLNLVFIPKFGIKGAVISSIAARLIVLMYMMIAKKMIHYIRFDVAGKAALSGIGAAACCYGLKVAGFGIAALPVAGILYLVCLYVLKEDNFINWIQDMVRVLSKKNNSLEG